MNDSSSNISTTPTKGLVYDDLTAWFLQFDSALVAFSGGVDSTLVLAAAVDSLGAENVEAVTACSPSLRTDELELCKEIAQSLGVTHRLLETKELQNPQYRANSGDRCYHCKSAMYESIFSYLLPLIPDSTAQVLVDGTNADDMNDIRPGMKAATEAGVLHPLNELSLGKDQVREFARLRQLPNWNKPAMACLSSRIPRGTEVTALRLAMIGKAEIALHQLGLEGARVRYHLLSQQADSSETLARIELAPELIEKSMTEELRTELTQRVREAGFDFVTIDCEGYKLGGRSQQNSLVSLKAPRATP